MAIAFDSQACDLRTTRHRFAPAVAITAGLLLGASGSLADERKPAPETADPAAQLTARIDAHIQSRLDEAGAVPAPMSSDAEFLRRVYLDLAGSIPPAERVREFLADPNPHKRQALIDELLAGEAYVTHFTSFWRNVWLPELANDPGLVNLVPSFDGWTRATLAAGTPYDDVARELLTFSLREPQPEPNRLADASPVAFYIARQALPENLAGATSRAFLGLRIECAQCHDHPLDTWKQQEFWRMAAFFGGIQRAPQAGRYGSVRELYDRREIMIPEIDVIVQAAYLDGTKPRWKPRQGAREALAEWMTSPGNDQFAKAAVNRLWGYFLGYGIVDPVDDFSQQNPPSHPALLDELAREFAAQDFDLKFLIRAIIASETYQRTSRRTDESQADSRLFARMSVRGLTAEQVWRSMSRAAGLPADTASMPQGARANAPRAELFELFAASHEGAAAQQASIPQALAVMNGAFVAQATSLTGNPRLQSLARSAVLPTETIDELYLATLSRFPEPDERDRLAKYIENGGPQRDRDQALCDVFWALLNSTEFIVNH